MGAKAPVPRALNRMTSYFPGGHATVSLTYDRAGLRPWKPP